MDPITLSSIIGYVALKCADQFIKDEGYGRFKKWWFTPTYKTELTKVIYATIENYEALNPVPKGDRFPFYHSQVLFDELLTFVVYGKQKITFDSGRFAAFPKMIQPTKEELESFFKFFNDQVHSSGKLKELRKLFASENYQARVLEIGDQLSAIKEELQTITELIVGQEIPLLAPSYFVHHDEGRLLAELKEHGVLLLSGISFCGKSQTAKSIAVKAINEGYRYYNKTNVSGADGVLKNSKGKCIVVLEDPFGHSMDNENKSAWRHVEELLHNLSPGNLLVITSRTEIVLSISKQTDLSQCSMNGNNWRDLTNTDAEFLRSCWNAFSLQTNFPQPESSMINQMLQDQQNSHLIQVGQLSYLSKIPHERIDGKGLDELLHLARVDSRQIANEIFDRGRTSINIYSALTLAASTVKAIDFEELAYYLNNENSTPSFVPPDPFETSKFFFSDDQVPEFPIYPQSFVLSYDQQRELEIFQHRGYLIIEEDKILFSHPTYHEAGRYLIAESRESDSRDIHKLAKSVLSGLNLNAAVNCLTVCAFAYKRVRVNRTKAWIRNLFFEAFKDSIFPAIADACLTYLIEIEADLAPDDASEIRYRLGKRISASNVFWHGDVPFFDRKKLRLFESTEKSLAEIEALIAEANTNSQVSKKDRWEIIKNLNNPEVTGLLNQTGISLMLSTDEVFIRSALAFALLNKRTWINEGVLHLVFNDSHPSVVFEAVRGALQGLSLYSEEQLALVKPLVISVLEQPVMSYRANNLLTTFGISYGSESLDWDNINDENKSRMWSFWAEIFPVFLKAAPATLPILNAGRLWVTFDDSIGRIVPKEGMEICSGYFQWIRLRMERRFHIDSYEYGWLGYLVDVTGGRYEARFKLFKAGLTLPDTGFALRSIRAAVNRWELLTDAEQALVLECLGLTRPDLRWLRAVALTQVKLPDEVAKFIVGRDDLLKPGNEQQIIENLPDNLLEDCLKVYFGRPQPLWWLSVHHGGEAVWHPVAKMILKKHHEAGFRFCLEELVSEGVNGYSRLWEDGEEIWEEICRSYPDKVLLGDTLIFYTSNTNYSPEPTKRLWNILISSCNEEQIAQLCNQLVERIEAIQENGEFADLFPDGFIDKHILPHLSGDNLLFGVLHNILRLVGPASVEDLAPLVDSVVEKALANPVRLKITFEVIDRLQEHSDSFPSLKRLLEIPNGIERIADEWLRARQEPDGLDGEISLQDKPVA